MRRKKERQKEPTTLKELVISMGPQIRAAMPPIEEIYIANPGKFLDSLRALCVAQAARKLQDCLNDYYAK